jgi:phenylpropionate dioxygenase-like ring-hydroxylating dioxygenase large terminal subunit
MADVERMEGMLGEFTTRAPSGPGEMPVGFPMPRDPGLLNDAGRRVHVTRRPGRRFPFPVPNGWFAVAESTDVTPGDVRALYYFGRDIVVFRGEDGAAHVVDAHCPHLGAHLAVGGRVEGPCLRCPFHGWLFEGVEGRCVEIPYGEGTRIPAKARTRAYPVVERNGLIFAWYHARDEAPFYEVPVVEEFDHPDWLPSVLLEFEVAVAAEDMAENNVDYAHFRFVHGSDAIPETEFHVDGTYKRTVSGDGDFVREGFGLGLGVLRVEGFTTFLSSTTPIDEEHVHVRWLFTAPVANGPDAAATAAEMLSGGVSQDIAIWENKVYRTHPVLTRSERPILEQRRWARQFYCEDLDVGVDDGVDEG